MCLYRGNVRGDLARYTSTSLALEHRTNNTSRYNVHVLYVRVGHLGVWEELVNHKDL